MYTDLHLTSICLLNQNPDSLVINGFADLMPKTFTGDNADIDIEKYFNRFRQSEQLHAARCHNNATKVGGLKYVRLGTALQWYNGIPTAGMPADLDELQDQFFAKFRIEKTRQEWKKELEKCKYVPGTSSLPMLNRFQVICNKLNWPTGVKIEKFMRILPMNLYQFAVSRAHENFTEVAMSVKTYQELIEVDRVPHIFKNVSFEDNSCILCHKPHKSLECPSLRSIIKMKVSSSTSTGDSGSSGSDNHSRSPDHDSRTRRPS